MVDGDGTSREGEVVGGEGKVRQNVSFALHSAFNLATASFIPHRSYGARSYGKECVPGEHPLQYVIFHCSCTDPDGAILT
jgi:hypothetical protein